MPKKPLYKCKCGEKPIKKCPFCGGNADVVFLDFFELYYVGCRKDFCHGDIDGSVGYDTKGQAIFAWDKRAK